MIVEENAQQPRPFLCTFFSAEMYARRGVINISLQILLLDFITCFRHFDHVVAIVLKYKVL